MNNSSVGRDGSSGVRIIEGPTLEQIAEPGALEAAWRKVRANKGGPGVDGETVEAFGPTREARLAELARALIAETYRPKRLKRFSIAKPGGKRRPLAIPTLIDRIAQTSALLAIQSHFDRRMHEESFGYRPGRNVEGAIAAVHKCRSEGLGWTLDGDIERFFERVPHGRLLDELAIWIDDLRVLRLLTVWLRGFSYWGRGIAQGSPLSPLLANVFLHPVDQRMHAEGFHMVRYADDFLVMAVNELQSKAAMKAIGHHLGRRGLQLSVAKTRIVAPGEPFRFLGIDFPVTEGHAHAHA